MELKNFEGIKYQLCDNWFDVLEVNTYCNRPINYLEIGTLCGANLLSVIQTYGKHKDSKLHCIDPWENYTEYPEYFDMQNNNYELFKKNINKLEDDIKSKIVINRGYSHNIVHTLEDNFFDIIYIDGNHEPEFVLEDAVLSFRKLKNNGVMIFDDYGMNGEVKTKLGIDAFIQGYHKRLNNNISFKNGQLFISKK